MDGQSKYRLRIERGTRKVICKRVACRRWVRSELEILVHEMWDLQDGGASVKCEEAGTLWW